MLMVAEIYGIHPMANIRPRILSLLHRNESSQLRRDGTHAAVSVPFFRFFYFFHLQELTRRDTIQPGRPCSGAL